MQMKYKIYLFGVVLNVKIIIFISNKNGFFEFNFKKLTLRRILFS